MTKFDRKMTAQFGLTMLGLISTVYFISFTVYFIFCLIDGTVNSINILLWTLNVVSILGILFVPSSQQQYINMLEEDDENPFMTRSERKLIESHLHRMMKH